MSPTTLQTTGAALVSTRTNALVRLGHDERATLQNAELGGRDHSARSELVREGGPVGVRQGLLSGWALRQRIMVDGQRQILGFPMPGDLVGNCHHGSAFAAATTVTIIEVLTCVAPRLDQARDWRKRTRATP